VVNSFALKVHDNFFLLSQNIMVLPNYAVKTCSAMDNEANILLHAQMKLLRDEPEEAKCQRLVKPY